MKKNIGNINSFRDLILFALPSIVMMIFMSSYTLVDGFFVSSYAGNDAFAALSLVYPLINIFIAMGVMMATGGSALVAKLYGEHEEKKGNRVFTSLYLTNIFLSIIVLIALMLWIEPLLKLLGTDSSTHDYAKKYITIILAFSPVAMTQMLFQSFFVTAGKPRLGLGLTILSGLSNIVLDYIFIKDLNMGIAGAAYATAIGYCMTAIPGTLFFLLKKTGLRFDMPYIKLGFIVEAMTNGSSEMVSNLANSITTLIFNAMMLKFIGNEGVVAMSVILYCQYLFTSMFMGYSIGVAPVISYRYGQGNEKKIRYFCKLSYVMFGIVSIFICLLTIIISSTLAQIFSNNNQTTYRLIKIGLRFFGVGFLICGVNIFSSSFFTALSDGFTSALISFSRTFCFIIANIYILSYLFRVNGLLLAIPLAELFTTILTICIFKHKYNKAFEVGISNIEKVC